MKQKIVLQKLLLICSLAFTFWRSSASELIETVLTSSTDAGSGNVVCAGFGITTGQPQPLVTSFDSSGALRTSFGTDGITTIPITSGTFSRVIPGSGSTFIAGGSSVTGGANALLARFTSAGALDGTFGTGGFDTYSFAEGSVVNDLIEVGAGAIIACGYRGAGGVLQAFAFKVDSSGTVDAGWGSSGSEIIFSTTSRAESIHDAGSSTAIITGLSGSNRVFTAKFDASGSLDGTYGTGGITEIVIQEGISGGFSVIDGSGFLYILSVKLGGELVISKLDSSGSPTATFTKQLHNGTFVSSAAILGSTLHVAYSNGQVSQIASIDTTAGTLLNTFDFGQHLSDNQILPINAISAGEGFLPVPLSLDLIDSNLYTVSTLGSLASILKSNTGLIPDPNFGTLGLSDTSELPLTNLAALIALAQQPCFCWNGLICSGLTGPVIIPTGCGFGTGFAMSNTATFSAIHTIIFSTLGIEEIDQSCKLLAIQPDDIIRVYATDQPPLHGDYRVLDRHIDTGFVGFSVTGPNNTGTVMGPPIICLSCFGPKSTTEASGLGHYLYVYATGTQSIDPANTWIDITWDVIGATDGKWTLSGSKEFICPRTAKYLLSYVLQYGGTLGILSETISTRILSGVSELLGSQASIGGMPLIESPKQLVRTTIQEIAAGAQFKLQHRATDNIFEIEVAGTGTRPVSAEFTITRIE